MPNLFKDLAHGLDAAAFAQDRLGFFADPWQRDLLRSPARQVILNCCRQSGKSTVSAIIALHTALFEPGALVLLISPSQRQSRELFAKVIEFIRLLEPVEELVEDNRLSAQLANRSRLVSLPGDAATVRGYSGPRLIVFDEAAYTDDALFTAISPMLAVSQGRLLLLSTPAGRRGRFYEIFNTPIGDDWLKVQVPAKDCPRISKEFLEKEKSSLGPLLFMQEYETTFVDSGEAAFSSEFIDRALTDNFEPFLTRGFAPTGEARV